MASLLDRLTGRADPTGDDPSLPASDRNINPMQFMFALKVVADTPNLTSGGGLTRAQLDSFFNLDAGQQAALNAIQAVYTGITGNATTVALKRMAFWDRLEVCIALETWVPGRFTDAQLLGYLQDAADGLL